MLKLDKFDFLCVWPAEKLSDHKCSWSHLCQAHKKYTTPASGKATIYYSLKMSDWNITQRGTQIVDLSVMIGSCFFDSQHWKPTRHPANDGYPFYMYTNDEQINHLNQRLQQRKRTREDNKLVLYCYFRSNLTQKGIEKESEKFGKNSFGLRQQTKDSLTLLEQ